MTNCNIVGFVHCAACLKADRRDEIAVGFTEGGFLQIWCEACQQQVMYLTALPVEGMTTCHECGEDHAKS